MAEDILLEIGLEEVPAQYVQPSSQQLAHRVVSFLDDNRIAHGEVMAYATPRRLAVKVKDVHEKQSDFEEELKGPSKKIAQDDFGQWSKAAIGFVSGQGASVDDIYFKEINGVDYVHILKKHPAKATVELLSGLKDVITSMTFPVTMTWGSHKLRYIRPIHWIVALYGDVLVPFSLLDVHTGKVTRGHRFLGQDTTINHPDEYVKNLEKEHVIVDVVARKEMIRQQIEDLAQKNNWVVPIDEELLDEVTSIVEYPTAFFGSFDKKYLEVADEVLITTMKEHQRYFYVLDNSHRLLPYFISVRNGNADHIDNVVKGNEKVLVARLEDALFFTKEDKNILIADAVEKLKTVNYHAKIGSVYEKMARTQRIATFISDVLAVDESIKLDVQRAGEIYKFDLMTNMVGEFPELQGIMGEKYALDQGENSAVATAIREHYLPIASNGELPETIVGSILALSDKLDAIISFFNVSIVPSGSNDPFSLRRQANGVIAILEKEEWHIHLPELIKQLVNDVYKVVNEQLVDQVIDFLLARLKQRLQTYGVRSDVIDAVTSSSSFDVPNMIADAKELNAIPRDETFKETIESLSRVLNLAKKVDTITDFEYTAVKESLFETESETALWQAINQLENNTYEQLATLTPRITRFFDENMVLVDDKAVRNNRLGILVTLSADILNYADVTLLVVK